MKTLLILIITCLASLHSMAQRPVMATFQITDGEQRDGINLQLLATDSTAFLKSTEGAGRARVYVYQNNSWTTQGQTRSGFRNFSVIHEKTGKTKMILSFFCYEYRVRIEGVSNGEDVRIWATTQLPATVNPWVGLTEFPAGILEVEFPALERKIQATGVTKQLLTPKAQPIGK